MMAGKNYDIKDEWYLICMAQKAPSGNVSDNLKTRPKVKGE